MHKRRTGRYNYAIQSVLFDIVGNHFLPGRRTHELVVSCYNNIWKCGCEFRQFTYTNRLGYIQTAVANKTPILLIISPYFFSFRIIILSFLFSTALHAADIHNRLVNINFQAFQNKFCDILH